MTSKLKTLGNLQMHISTGFRLESHPPGSKVSDWLVWSPSPLLCWTFLLLILHLWHLSSMSKISRKNLFQENVKWHAKGKICVLLIVKRFSASACHSWVKKKRGDVAWTLLLVDCGYNAGNMVKFRLRTAADSGIFMPDTMHPCIFSPWVM